MSVQTKTCLSCGGEAWLYGGEMEDVFHLINCKLGGALIMHPSDRSEIFQNARVVLEFATQHPEGPAKALGMPKLRWVCQKCGREEPLSWKHALSFFSPYLRKEGLAYAIQSLPEGLDELGEE